MNIAEYVPHNRIKYKVQFTCIMSVYILLQEPSCDKEVQWVKLLLYCVLRGPDFGHIPGHLPPPRPSRISPWIPLYLVINLLVVSVYG